MLHGSSRTGMIQAGHDVWWDRHLHGGSRFAKEIDQALKNAEAVVVLWSEESLESAWVQERQLKAAIPGASFPFQSDRPNRPSASDSFTRSIWALGTATAGRRSSMTCSTQ